ncbi:MAG: PDDEXK nuclease domain-containing protein [Pelobacteraceae bacterium]
MAKKTKLPVPVPGNDIVPPVKLADDIRHLIQETKTKLGTTVNAALTLLNWRIGTRILADVLQGQRAEYGEQIIVLLAQQLEQEFGRGFSHKSLRHMVRFAETFPDGDIVSTLSRQLAWSHFLEIIYLKEPLQRCFYAEMCRIERWSVRALRQKVGSMLFERTALSKKPATLIEHEIAELRAEDRLTTSMVLKDPYILDFLGLNDRYLEKDLEDAILREIEKFLLEMGAGFSFVARQKRLQIDNDDFYIDLLFYNRKLKRLVAVELKLGDFRHEHKSQMELYLRWLAKYEQEPDEQPPLGIIMCSGKKREQIELLELNQSGIHVAEYLTVLPPRELLERKLHEAIQISRARLVQGAGDGQ